MYLPAFPALAREFRASESVAELTLTACMVGLAAGQALGGPVSDALGRKLPLLVAVTAYTLASVLCARAPGIELLIASRFLEGLSGGAGMVVAYAVARDRFSGDDLARFYSALILVTMLSPLLAPTAGGQLLRVLPWHGIFLFLGGLGALLFVAIWRFLPETLAIDQRRRGGVTDAVQTMAGLARDRAFLQYALPPALSGGALLCYIAASSFVFQGVYGVSPQAFGLLFGLNGVVIGIASQTNRLLVGTLSSLRLFSAGLAALACCSLAVVAVVLVGGLGIVALLIPLVLAIATHGFVQPNGTALALGQHPESAGSGAAVIGTLRFAFGAVAAPLVGIGGSRTAFPMAITMFAFAAAAGLAYIGFRRAAAAREEKSWAEA